MMAIVPEVWKDVIGNSNYQVSSEGRVRSVDRRETLPSGKTRRRDGRILKLVSDNYGYCVVSILNGVAHEKKVRKVHQLVAEAWHGPRPEGLVVNHKDGCKTNNRPGNLEYASVKENARHAIATGLTVNFGEHHTNAKMTEAQIRVAIDLYNSGKNGPEAAAEAGISYHCLSNVVQGRNWKHLLLEAVKKGKSRKIA